MTTRKPSSTTSPDGSTNGAELGIEHELKLAAHPGFELPDLESSVPGLAARPTGMLELDATYHDTEDLRLARRGVTLRRRTGEGAPLWTLKFPAGQRGGDVLARREIEMPDAERSCERPTVLEDLVTAFTRSLPLQPVARLRSVRHRVELRSVEGPVLGEIDDDEVLVMAGDEVRATFREIELEFAPSAHDDLVFAVIERLTAAGAGAPDPTPKLVRALGPRALAPPELVPVQVGPGASVGELVGAGLVRDTSLVVDHDHLVRLDEDVEGVHGARVGTRRLRSNLKTFRGVLDRSWAAALRDELRWLGDVLGEVRDADVLLSVLRADVATMANESDREAGAALLGLLERERGAALSALLGAMRSERYIVLLDRLVEAANTPALTSGADDLASEVVPRLVHRHWRQLRSAVRRLDDHPADDELHTVRILAKRVRYATDIAVPIAAAEAVGFAKALARLQDVLGALHDAMVAERWLRTASTATTHGETLVAGELLARCEARARSSRTEWQVAWHETDRKEHTGWMR